MSGAEFKNPYQVLLNHASRPLSSHVHLQDIVDRVMGNPDGPWKHSRAIVNLYLDQFGHPQPAISSPATTFKPIYALLGLWIATERDRSDDLGYIIKSSWLKLWPWIDFLYRKVIIAGCDVLSKTNRYALTIAIQAILLRLIRRDFTLPTVAGTEGTLALSLEMHIHFGRHPPDKDREVLAQSENTSFLAVTLIESPLSNFNEVIEVLGSGKKAASTLFQPFLMIAHGRLSWAAFFPLFIEVHKHLMVRNSGYYQSLPVDKIMSHICEALTYFTTNAPWVHDVTLDYTVTNKTHNFLKSLLSFLVVYSVKIYGGGHSWAVYAVRGGLLPLILKCAPYTATLPEMEITMQSLLDNFRINAIHRPIMRVLSRDPEVLGRRFSSTSKIVQGSWKKLLQGISHAEDVHGAFKARRLCVLWMGSLSSFATAVVAKLLTTARWRANESTGGTTAKRVDHIVCDVIYEWRNMLRIDTLARGFLDSPRNIAFFRFIIEEKMKDRKHSLRKDRDYLMGNTPRPPPPYFFVLDYSTYNPPGDSIETVVDFVKACDIDLPRIPILIPYIFVFYGGVTHRMLLSAELSGELFGWIDELDEIVKWVMRKHWVNRNGWTNRKKSLGTYSRLQALIIGKDFLVGICKAVYANSQVALSRSQNFRIS
ncbi:hypothetical protein DXG01_003971 [Tephrocybe rancida]|nr:hypothetical protein DXG01_003971 [Tephrocybe rancida]